MRICVSICRRKHEIYLEDHRRLIGRSERVGGLMCSWKAVKFCSPGPSGYEIIQSAVCNLISEDLRHKIFGLVLQGRGRVGRYLLYTCLGGVRVFDM